MPIRIQNTDILANTNYIIILPIDDIGPGHEGRLGRLPLSLAAGFEIDRVTTIVLKGGWRLSLDEAFLAMLDACEAFSGLKNINFEIFEQDQDKFNRIRGLGQSLGWL